MNTPNIRYIQIRPYGVETCGPLATLDFNLPNSGYIDLSTLLMFYNFIHSNSGAGNSCALTKDAESIINDLEVYVNGTPVNIIKNYNQVFNVVSRYGLTGEEVFERGVFSRTLLNGNPSTGPASTTNETYCCKKWLGFLGCSEVIDLSRNSIHIRITTAERFVIAGLTTNDTYSLSQIYMTAMYYERYNAPLKTQIEFDDYKSLYNYLPSSSTVETSLKFISDNVDYAVATFYNNTLHRTVGTTIVDGVVSHFQKLGYCDTWNFKVNGKFMYSYDVPIKESQMTMFNVFKHTFKNIAAFAQPITGPGAVLNSGNNRAFHAGCPIKMQLDEAEEVEITFTSKQASPSTNVPHFMYVKLNKALNIN